MSSVRMCDKCRTIFSENDEDWTTVTGRQKQRNPETNRLEWKEIEQDWCGPCTTGNTLRPELEAPKTPRTYEEYRQQALGENQD